VVLATILHRSPYIGYAHAVFIALKRLKTALTATLYSTTKPSDRSAWIFQGIPTRKANRECPSGFWPIPTGYSKEKRGGFSASPSSSFLAGPAHPLLKTEWLCKRG